METQQEQRLRKLLTDISDSYDDFVFGAMLRAKRYNLTDKLIDLISNSDDITTSQVVGVIADMCGIKKVNQGESQ